MHDSSQGPLFVTRVTLQLPLVKGGTVRPSGAHEFAPVFSVSALTWFIIYIYY